jgi:hypothetical protein
MFLWVDFKGRTFVFGSVEVLGPLYAHPLVNKHLLFPARGPAGSGASVVPGGRGLGALAHPAPTLYAKCGPSPRKY